MSKYIDWIRMQNCAVCQAPPLSDPHHIIGDGHGTMGGKSPDVLLIPLCRKHHDQLHKVGPRAWEEMYCFDQADLLNRILRLASYEGWRMEQIT